MKKFRVGQVVFVRGQFGQYHAKAGQVFFCQRRIKAAWSGIRQPAVFANASAVERFRKTCDESYELNPGSQNNGWIELDSAVGSGSRFRDDDYRLYAELPAGAEVVNF